MKARHLLARQEAENYVGNHGKGQNQIDFSKKANLVTSMNSFFAAFKNDVDELRTKGWATQEEDQPWKSHAPKEDFDKLNSRQKLMLKILRLWHNRNGKKVERTLFAIADATRRPFEGFCNALKNASASPAPTPTTMAVGSFSWHYQDDARGGRRGL